MHTPLAAPPVQRDPRIDFFRGLALIFIFIDHIPDNSWAYGTLKNFGFADASEVFVLLSGYSAALAYRLGEDQTNFAGVWQRSWRRAWTIYLWHLAVFAASAVLLFWAAHYFQKPAYVNNIWLQNLSTDPVTWIRSALVLTYQPNQMNILPLYIVLMLWFPVQFALFRLGVTTALTVSVGIWAIANIAGLNLPANTPGEGWYFNPFAWQLLFATGAAVAILARRQELNSNTELLTLAVGFLLFSLIYAAPWVAISWLPNNAPLPKGIVGNVSKADLSLWRYLHVLALAYVAATLVSATSTWLKTPAAKAVALCGRHSLQIFALGTVLSFLAWIVITELGTRRSVEFVVNVAGIALMAWAAARLSRQKAARAAEPAVHTVPA